jgi:heterodisulfide reductase subunit C
MQQASNRGWIAGSSKEESGLYPGDEPRKGRMKKGSRRDEVSQGAGFARWLKEESGEDVFRCYQCLKCSTGCPMAQAMDILPSQVIRMAQLGRGEELLHSETIWVCVSCYTCSIRCPNDIHVAHVMDALRELALKEGIPPKRERVVLFHQLFLASIREYGRVYEAKLLAKYEAKAGGLMKNVPLGLAMFLRGKIALLPHKVEDIKGVRETFVRLEEDTEK